MLALWMTYRTFFLKLLNNYKKIDFYLYYNFQK